MQTYEALCEYCGQCFLVRKSLYVHLRQKHQVDVRPKKEVCSFCDKTFLSVDALDRHVKTHTSPPPAGKVLCTECEFTCSSKSDLRSHLQTVHGIEIEKRELEFNTIEEFHQWKMNMEGEDNVSFVVNGSARLNENQDTRLYYECHRSGTVKKKGKGQRSRKHTVKIGRTCPASLIVKQTSGKVCVQYYVTHTGHDLALGSLRLTRADREMVSQLIKAGVSDDEVLEKVRIQVEEGHFKRLQLLEKKDIYNVKQTFNLDMSRAHEVDAVSVHLWVQQQSLLEDSSVIFYKQQGAEDETLSKDDFMLAIMTPFQVEMANKFLCNKVLIDSTHGTNKYNFHLTTLMTVDEYAVGCPVAYCLSTRTDQTSMKVFLEAVKSRTGNVKTKVFVSDDCNSYYNAWSSVMGPSEHRLLCSWHVDQAWTRNLRKKVKDTMLRCSVYKGLKILQFQTDEAKF